MTDVLPRLDGAFDGSDKRALDRRQLLKAGAWAAPVLLLATATPAAAASAKVPDSTPDFTGNAIVLTSFDAQGGQTETNPYLNVHFDYYYQAGNFAVPDAWGNGSPAAVPTSWSVSIKDAADKVVFSDSGTQTLDKGSNGKFSYSKHLPSAGPALQKGALYTVVLTVTPLTAQNAAGKTLLADPIAKITNPKQA